MGRYSVMLVLLCFISSNLKGQMEGFPAISERSFETIVSPIIDSGSHAVVLWEQGTTEIVLHEAGRGLRLNHKYGVRIKILDREGFEKANYVLPLFKIGSEFEYAQKITGFTHTFDGQIQTMSMDKSAIFNERLNDYVQLTKLSLPNISEGSIIDIFYEVVSPDIFNFRTWKYQDDIPKLYSQYTAIIPALFEYNASLKGEYELTDFQSSKLEECFLLNGNRYDCSKLVYTMKNIPAFKEESYMLAPANYMSAINFELMQYHVPGGGTQVYTKDWKAVDIELLSDASFGKQLESNRDLRRILSSTVTSSDSDLDKAKKIYQYFQNQIRWNQNYGKYTQVGVRQALEQRSGNIGDVNLGLIATLRQAGLEAYPVVLSTRQNGLPNPVHPVLSDFNYVIAQVNVDGQSYFLDASERNLPFGLLPLRCINGQGRIIYSRKSSEWIDLENRFDARIDYAIMGEINEEGLFTGSLTRYYQGLTAFNQRNHIHSFSSVDTYLEDQMDRLNPIRIRDGQIENLDSLDDQLVESFEITLDLSKDMRDGQFSVNPIFVNRITTNPFNLEERNYHVDLGSKISESLTVSIRLPKSYSLQQQPKNVSFSLPEKAASYIYQSQSEMGLLQLRQTMTLNKAIYEPDEYYYLKEFFSMIIQHQRIDYIFKKEEINE